MTIAVFIIFMATLALVDGLDCQKRYKNDHNRFVCRHVLQEIIPDKTDWTAWERYITKYKLCNKNRLFQSFMEKQPDADAICKGYGNPKSYTCDNKGKLCTSNSHIDLYHITLDSNCKVTKLFNNLDFAVVSCEKVDNQCRPVHFVKLDEIKQNWKAQPCHS